MELAEFLKTVVTGDNGWFCLATAELANTEEETEKTWKEVFYSWPDELTTIVNDVSELGSDVEVYFSPYLFREPKSIKSNAIVGRTIVADLDDANVLTIQITPSIVVETSPGRHQGYWILNEELDAQEHERISKKITYSIPRCDRTGWFLGKKVRVPTTYNNKYKNTKHFIRIVDSNSKHYSAVDLEQFVVPQEFADGTTPDIDENDLAWADAALNQSISAQEMLAQVKSSIASVYMRYNMPSTDRSAALWSLTTSLFRIGMKRDKVFYIAWHSVNNKFKDLRYGAIKALAKDVLRAEVAISTKLPDIKEKIRYTRNLGDNPVERQDHISKLAREYLEQIGIFYHCTDGSVWYIRHDTGKPIQINSRNEALSNMLDVLFGINAAEAESRYVHSRLRSYASELPVTARLAHLTTYDHNSKLFVLHTGRRDVLAVTPTQITRQVNGYGGLVFPWNMGNNIISPQYESIDLSWDEILFGGCLDNVLDIDKNDAQAVLKVWLLSVLLRDGLASRPILALFGAPGSGKSTMFRRIYRFFFGKERGLNTVTNENDFDIAMSSDPLVVLDNADSMTGWLPDRMAATVAPTEIVRRKLFTDTDTITIRRDAMLGITAHNPKFSREDVTDRMLLFTFDRLPSFKSDSEILSRIDKNRNAIWGSVLRDIQTTMNTPMPSEGYPQFRIRDFAMYGYWIATALGVQQEFKRGLEAIKQGQRNFNLEEDTLLVDAIDKLLDSQVIEEMTAGVLWTKLSFKVDQKQFTRKYANPVVLGRKLWTLLDSLREIYDVDWKPKGTRRVWTIRKKTISGVHTNGTAPN